MNFFKFPFLFFPVFLLLLFSINPVQAQKVGVVLSGGAASGLAHVGVLKALEENQVPIDYITGTSVGAFVGSMYAMGYSPGQIEALVKTNQFKDWATGLIDDKYTYYFKRTDDNASWGSFKLSLDSTLSTAFPTNIISPVAMDFGMMELAAGPAAVAKYNFDSLFIPFRCVASDIEKKESVVFNKGDLAEAIRASMSYPFYIKPILVGDKLLFDGGLYNNFPSNIMLEDFYPDFMIGSNVTGNSPPPDEDDVMSQVRNMLQSKSNYNILCEAGVIIEPKSNVGLFDFSNVQSLIDSGYAAAMRHMDFIKQHVERNADKKALAIKRNYFKGKAPKIMFDKFYIEGLNESQSEYVKKVLRHKSKVVSFEELKAGYFRLAADNKIKYMYPKAKYNEQSGYYDLYLRVKKERELIIDLGGNISTRPISEGYLGLQYNYLGRFAARVMGNAYFGKLYSSSQFRVRFDFPNRVPFFVEPIITWNKWDYYKSSVFFGGTKPAYLIQDERFINLNAGFPTGKKGRIVGGAELANLKHNYYQTSNFDQADTSDVTNFDMFSCQGYYEINSLNRKQYANQGEYIKISGRYVHGLETNIPGSTATGSKEEYSNYHNWIVLKLTGERYFNRRGSVKIGFFGEAVYSSQTFFNNYTASMLFAPAFAPTPFSKTIFNENYRANQYVSGGVKFVVNIHKKIEFRAEGYIYQPYQTLMKMPDLTAVYSYPFFSQHYLATTGLVWHTPVGPASFSVNYMEQAKESFSFLFHFGYIIFNKRALE